jgi:hypothetical protein
MNSFSAPEGSRQLNAFVQPVLFIKFEQKFIYINPGQNASP